MKILGKLGVLVLALALLGAGSAWGAVTLTFSDYTGAGTSNGGAVSGSGDRVTVYYADGAAAAETITVGVDVIIESDSDLVNATATVVNTIAGSGLTLAGPVTGVLISAGAPNTRAVIPVELTGTVGSFLASPLVTLEYTTVFLGGVTQTEDLYLDPCVIFSIASFDIAPDPLVFTSGTAEWKHASADLTAFPGSSVVISAATLEARLPEVPVDQVISNPSTLLWTGMYGSFDVTPTNSRVNILALSNAVEHSSDIVVSTNRIIINSDNSAEVAGITAGMLVGSFDVVVAANPSPPPPPPTPGTLILDPDVLDPYPVVGVPYYGIVYATLDIPGDTIPSSLSVAPDNVFGLNVTAGGSSITVSGMPTNSGWDRVVVTATDSAGNSHMAEFYIVVEDPVIAPQPGRGDFYLEDTYISYDGGFTWVPWDPTLPGNTVSRGGTYVFQFQPRNPLVTLVGVWLTYPDGRRWDFVGLGFESLVEFKSTMPTGVYRLEVYYEEGGIMYYHSIPIRVVPSGGGGGSSDSSSGCTTAGFGFAALALVGLLRKKR